MKISIYQELSDKGKILKRNTYQSHRDDAFVQWANEFHFSGPLSLVFERVILEEKGQKRKTMRLMNGSRVADVSLSPRVTCIYARTN